VINYIAYGILATSSRTGVNTLAAMTSLIPRTVGIENALGSAAGVGIAMEFGQASADSSVALGIRATRRWVAGIHVFVY